MSPEKNIGCMNKAGSESALQYIITVKLSSALLLACAEDPLG